jgi:hypothetical protein
MEKLQKIEDVLIKLGYITLIFSTILLMVGGSALFAKGIWGLLTG